MDGAINLEVVGSDLDPDYILPATSPFTPGFLLGSEMAAPASTVGGDQHQEEEGGLIWMQPLYRRC